MTYQSDFISKIKLFAEKTFDNRKMKINSKIYKGKQCKMMQMCY